MITAWMLYAVVVGGLLGAGGLALEKLQRTHGLPARWTWAGAIILSIGWPLGHWALEHRPLSVSAVPLPDVPVVALSEIPMKALTLEPVVVELSSESFLRLLDGPIMVAWALATGVLTLFFAFLFLRTHTLRTHWRRGKADGQSILFSDEWGPAVVGFVQPQIVLPNWCQEMDDWALRFILEHELEHVRAGDLRLIILSGVLPVLFPWHIPLWWQLARLRTAVEGDCDLRVIGRNPGQVRPYVDLLLDVGKRSTRGRPLAAMLSEPYETLKRRIRIMTMPLPKKPWVRGGLLAGAVAISVALACWAPGPTDAQNGEDSATVEDVSPGAVGLDRERSALPAFTPYTVIPSIKNPEEVVAALAREYPPVLKAEGIGGEVGMWLFVDEESRVQRIRVNQSSGYKVLDDAALGVANIVEFTPALNRDKRMPVWVSLPIVFTTDEGFALEDPESGSVAAGQGRTVGMVPPEVVATVPGLTGVILGTAFDEATDQPLPGAQLLVAGTGRGTLSNQNGQFVITDVPSGERELFAVVVGYGQIRQRIVVETQASTEVEVRLEPTAIELTPLVVRGTAFIGR